MDKKMKILCLHGYGTNAEFMKKQAASFMKLISRQADLIFVNGPFLAPENFVMDQKVIDMIEGKHLSWFPTVSIQYSKQQFLNQIVTIKQALQAASDHYDGIIGFSQGAVLSHFLFKLKQSKLIDWKILDNIKFSINLSGNHWKSSLFDNYRQLQIPSLHLVSPQDFLFAKSIITTTQYKNPIVMLHSYGHKFPKLGVKQSKTIINFIRKYAGKKPDQKIDTENILTSSKL